MNWANELLLEKALKEWRDARQAIFDLAGGELPNERRWQRLANAEHALMKQAMELK